MRKVLIIGGGFAGLSAGVALSRQGCSVTLLEQRRLLGGRAYSIPDGTTGDWVDNGQHALLGGFHETRKFLKTLGTEDLIKYQDRFQIVLVKPSGQRLKLVSFNLPAPFHLAAGVLRTRGFSWSDRFHLLRAGRSIMFTRQLHASQTVTDWMDALHQPESLRKQWWYPIATAALNEQPHRASANLFLRVLKMAFFGSSRNSPFGIMKVSLGELYTEQAKKLIETNGGSVLINAPVRQIHFSQSQVDSVEVQEGRRLTADAYISAVPHASLKRMVPADLIREGSPFAYLEHLSNAPILSVHLWFDRPVMDEDFIGLVESPIHWVFDKSRLWQKNKTDGGAVACVVSGAYDLIGLPPQELITLTTTELSRYLPEVKKAKLQHSRLIKERQATFSCTPEAEHWRPAQETPYSNFYLAGDWTRTGLPATIEGAVLSGHRCASLIISNR
jgi:hydroxysqualene dehydroxylase